MLSTFGAFAAAFPVRPPGGSVFGPPSDRAGRQQVLALTMIMMAAGTFAIGLIPSYTTIGVGARLVRGFSTDGEYAGASAFIAEYAPDGKRGFFGSRLEFGTLAGCIGGAGPVTALIGATGDMTMPAYYMTAAAVIGGFAVWRMTESAGRPLPGSAPSVARG